ncbi:hypothetical protein ADUPG1_007161, partial [Aduncisulcus paluster]
MEYGSSSVISGCIEDWYGTDCDKSCPVINSSVCGGTNGTCEESTHTCSCSSSYLGDACEYINFTDSDLEAYICDTASTLVTCVDDHITPSEMLNMTALDLSSLTTITDLTGLEFATNLTTLDLSNLSFDAATTEVIDNIPISVVTLSMDNADVAADTSFSTLIHLTTLSLVGNTSFNVSSSGFFPSTLTSIDISGCTGFTNLEYLPSSLEKITMVEMNASAGLDFSSMTSLNTIWASGNPNFDATSSGLFPSSLVYLDANQTSCSHVENLPSSLVSLYLDDVGVGASTSFAAFTGLETLSLVNSSSFNMSSSSQLPSSLKYLDLGGCSSFDGLSYLPTGLTTLSLDGVGIAADTSFVSFSSLTTLSVANNPLYNVASAGEFPSTITSLDISGCSSSSFNMSSSSQLPSSLKYLDLGGCSSFDGLSYLPTGLTTLSLDGFDDSVCCKQSSVQCCLSLYLDDVGVGASTSFAAFTGLETLSLVNSSSFNMSSSSQLPSSLKYLDLGGCSSFDGLSYLPTGLTTLSLDGVGIAADTSFVSFSSLTTLSVANNPLYNVASAGEFPSTITSLDISGCSSFDGLDYLPTDIEALYLDGIGLELAASMFSSFTTLYLLSIRENGINDVSPLVTESILPSTLTSLALDGNKFSDSDGVETALLSQFTNLVTVTTDDQEYECSAFATFSGHEVCREIIDGFWNVECWTGYYLDLETNSCLKACPTGYASNSDGECISIPAITFDNSIKCLACENQAHVIAAVNKGESEISCLCRAVWYGEDCTDLYDIYIPNYELRMYLCDLLGQGETLCNLTAFDMAEISGTLTVKNNSSISSIEGIEYLVSVGQLHAENTSLVDVTSLGQLTQISSVYLYSDDASSYPMNIADFSSFQYLNRIFYGYIYGNEEIYDISVFYRNVGMFLLGIANTTYSRYISVCHSESDSDYWDYLLSVFPIHFDSESVKESTLLPNSCSLNSSNYSCSGTDGCPSVVLNEVYNPISGIRECASIAKTDGSADTLDL